MAQVFSPNKIIMFNLSPSKTQPEQKVGETARGQIKLTSDQFGDKTITPVAETGSPAAPENFSLAISPTIAAALPQLIPGDGPAYPLAARRKQEHGISIIRVVIDKTGSPRAINLVASSGYPALDKSAIDYYGQKAQYRPGMNNGQPIESELIIPVRFELK